MGDSGLWPQPSGLLPAAVSSSADAFTPFFRNDNWGQAEARIADIITQIQPNQASEERRKSVIQYVRRIISKCFDCKVFTFGSVPLKTYLPDGDIDLTTFSQHHVKDIWANAVRSVLEEEELKQDVEFRVREVHYIHAEVKIIKCLVENIVVDISFNQLGGLSTLCFLEEVDRLIGQKHLFKRSIILVKAWCYYESRILGAHHGLISTYALETMVLYIFHVFHASLRGPLEVLFRFLDFFSKFDWDNYCVSLWGPVTLSSLPYMAAQPPRGDGGELLLSNEFLIACSQAYASFPYDQEGQTHQTFTSKFMNVIDPLRVTNNLGRSVSKGNFFRIRSAFSYGARKLASILCRTKVDVINELDCFFQNTLLRHGSGKRPDAPDSISDYLSQHLRAESVTFDAEDGFRTEEKKHTYDHLKEVDDVKCMSNLLDRKCQISTSDTTMLAESPVKSEYLDPFRTKSHGETSAVEPSPVMTVLEFFEGASEINKNSRKITDVMPSNHLESASLTSVTKNAYIPTKDIATNLSIMIEDVDKNPKMELEDKIAGNASSSNDIATFMHVTKPDDFIGSMVQGEGREFRTVRMDDARDVAHRNLKAFDTLQTVVEMPTARESSLPLTDGILLLEGCIVESLGDKAGYEHTGSAVEGLVSEVSNSSSQQAITGNSVLLDTSSPVGHRNHIIPSLPCFGNDPAGASASGHSPTSTQLTLQGMLDPHLNSSGSTQGCSTKFQRHRTEPVAKGERLEDTHGSVQIPDASHADAPFYFFSGPYQPPTKPSPDLNGTTLGVNSADFHFRDRSPEDVNDVESDLNTHPRLSVPIPIGVVESLKAFGVRASRSSALQDSGSSSTMEEAQTQDSRFDSLCGDFSNHLNCLGYGRFCQYLNFSVPMWMEPTFILPPWYLQGRHPWEGPGRPLQTGTEMFGNVYSPRSSFYPESAPIRSSGRGKYRSNAPDAFGQEEPRRHRGGTYLPNLRNGAYSQRQFSLNSRGRHVTYNQDHNGVLEQDGTQVFTPRYRIGGRGHNKQHARPAQHHPFSWAEENSSTEQRLGERAQETQKHGNFKKANGDCFPRFSAVTPRAPANAVWTPTSVERLHRDAHTSPSSSSSHEKSGPVVPPIFFAHSTSADVTGKSLEFGSIGPLKIEVEPTKNESDYILKPENSVGMHHQQAFVANSVPSAVSHINFNDRHLQQPLSPNNQQRHKQHSYELKGEDFPPLTPGSHRGSSSRPAGGTVTGRTGQQ